MPIGKFFPKLTVDSTGVVKAAGPLGDASNDVVEMCVWVYQRSSDGSDAIANMMQDGPALKDDNPMIMTPPKLKISPTRLKNQFKWNLDLTDRMNRKAEFKDGSATAVAIGVFLDEKGNERLLLWSEPVELQVSAPAKATPTKGTSTKGMPMKGAPAKRTTAKRSSAKRSPAKRSTAKRSTAKRSSAKRSSA